MYNHNKSIIIAPEIKVNFSLCPVVLSYLTVDTAHYTHLYTVVYGSLSG
jgi:hypothetical protein